MRRFLFIVLLAALGHAKSLNNPLSSLMKKDASPELKAFVEQIMNTIATHVAFSALGLPPSLEEFKNDMANMTIGFWLLPLKDQKYIFENFKGYGEEAKSEMKLPMAADMALVESRMNSAATRLLLEKVQKSCNLLKEHTRCIGLIHQEDPELAKVLENFINKAVEQYNKLSSQTAKDFVYETMDHLVKLEEKEPKDEDWEHIKGNFVKLSHHDKVDVVRKMTWYLDPLFEHMHNMITAAGKQINK